MNNLNNNTVCSFIFLNYWKPAALRLLVLYSFIRNFEFLVLLFQIFLTPLMSPTSKLVGNCHCFANVCSSLQKVTNTGREITHKLLTKSVILTVVRQGTF